MKVREFWISEACELPPPVPYVDKDVDDLILTVPPSELHLRANWVHVIEYSAYEKLKKRVEELEAAIQGARAHAEVMEHKATRVNAMLRDREAENEKLKDDCEFFNGVIKERESVNAVHLRTLNKLEKEIEELKIKLEQLEGTTQNAFERWQNALDREEKLTQDLSSAKELIGKLKKCCKDFEFILEGSRAVKQSDEMLEKREEAFMRALGYETLIKNWEAGK